MKFKKGDKVVCIEGCVQVVKRRGTNEQNREEVVKDKVYTVEKVFDIGPRGEPFFFITLDGMNCAFSEEYFRKHLTDEDNARNFLDSISEEL